MKKKYFFFDIDGTLTDNRTKEIVPSAQQALLKLQEAGHFVSIATGRAHYKARAFMDSVHLHNMVCCGGGALVVDDVLLYNYPLDLEKAKAIAHEADDLGYGLLFLLDDSINLHGKDDLFRQQVGERQEATNTIINPDLKIDDLTEIYKMYISISEADDYKITLKDTLGNSRFVKDYLMFQIDAKHQGIMDMMHHLKAPIEDVVVFGDDYNDMIMFDPRWTSIAMGNACDALKEKADFVTKSNLEDGIDYACKHFNWYDPVNE